MAFTGASDFTLEGGANNYVQGDQNIYHTITHVTHQQQEKELTIYDEFYNIKLGAVHRIRNVHCMGYSQQCNPTGRKSWETGRLRVERMICIATVHGEQELRFTDVSYRGPDAKKAWKKDFKQFSRISDAMKWQLFGINQSSVPHLIFHGDLVPIVNFWDGLGRLGQIYISTLAFNLRCDKSAMWIDPKQGTLIYGLPGSDRMLHRKNFLSIKALPPSAEFLQEDVCWQYFSNLPRIREFDREVIIMHHSISEVQGEISTSTNQPYVLSSLTDSRIVIGNGVWTITERCFESPVIMADGRTRFTLTDQNVSEFSLHSLQYLNISAWLSQASSVFHSLGVSMDEDLSHYKFITPRISLRGSFKHSKLRHQRYTNGSPLYLFIHSLHDLPLFKEGSAVTIHTWSLDEDGQTFLSPDCCKYLGLPTKLWVSTPVTVHQLSWSTKAYEIIHKWQVARGFDPTTTDFASYLGFPVYNIVQAELVQVEESNSTGGEDGKSSPIRSIWSTLMALIFIFCMSHMERFRMICE
ncbi:hypothetical protein L218DRAFT_991915 [Marasmius fiardii PR-910]|nr:hypothetical protein L218DRAFT_991915 [Marasmius fiardii PR-910]